MRLKLLFTLAFTAIFQIATTVATHAESSQIDRLVSQRNLASSLNISNISNGYYILVIYWGSFTESHNFIKN